MALGGDRSSIPILIDCNLTSDLIKLKVLSLGRKGSEVRGRG